MPYPRARSNQFSMKTENTETRECSFAIGCVCIADDFKESSLT